jgi:AFG3 family protein
MISFQSVLWFNIGSVDSFERNLENAQIEMNLEPANFIPVIYKNEIEASNITGILPTLLIIGTDCVDVGNLILSSELYCY